MCAIIGIASSTPVYSRDWLIAGRDSMRHRGPDDKGEWWSNDNSVGFAHRRLSIIDESSAGHQPMRNSVGDVTVVFNGEIYNFRDLKTELSLAGHKFITHCDTEVLIAAWREWGSDCVKHLNGMFAFAIHDAKFSTIFLARDRAGEKPLFYSYKGGELRFSSELKGLLCDQNFSRSMNHKALNIYLERGYIPGELCIFEGVNKLPPATALLFKYRLNDIKKWTYWSPPKLNYEPLLEGQGHNYLLDELEVLLENSVRQQLYADVPVGVLLSGGLDSSLIAAVASRMVDQVNTFTVNFTGHEKHNESSYARLISNHFNTHHTEIEAGEVSTDILFKLAHQFDEPMCDSSMIPMYLLSKQVKNHCKVALGGDGGDELFGGYGYYNRLLHLQKISRWTPIALRKFISRASTSMLPIGFQGRYLLQSMGMELKEELPLIGSFFTQEDRIKLLGERMMHVDTSVAEDVTEVLDLVRRATKSDFNNFLAEDILVKIDRCSMLNSLEIRAPFLDKNVINFAFGRVPSSLKVTLNDRKILLKQLGRRLLPEKFDFDRKQGFSIPLESWMRNGPWRDVVHDTLLSQHCFFDKEIIKNMLSGLDSGRGNSERLFCLVLFELWRSEYNVT
jgi:asparagine synthase (glutamine-hydrolysing)